MVIDRQDEPLLQVERLQKSFRTGNSLFGIARKRKADLVHAVEDVSFQVQKGEIFGIAGESGSGKSVTTQLIARLLDADSGRIVFGGLDVTNLKGRALRKFRRRVQLVFQDPFDSVNPRLTIERAVAEPLVVHNVQSGTDRRDLVANMLGRVGLTPAAKYLGRYPHELSGGELQRACIARALILEPNLLIADEPTSMLDVSVRAGIINLFNDLRTDLGLTILFISHDLSTIAYLCDRTAIMYRGRIVETGPTQRVLDLALHPYTAALMAAVPVADPDVQRNPPALKAARRLSRSKEHCVFSDRCPACMEKCQESQPDLRRVQGDHQVACFLHG